MRRSATGDRHTRPARGARLLAAVLSVAAVLGTLSLLPARAEDPAAAEQGSTPISPEELARQIRDLRHELAELSEARETEIRALERRIADLEESLRQAERREEEASTEALRREAAAAAAAEADRERQAEAQRETAAGRTRNLQALNPETSFLGDISYDWSDDPDVRDQFLVRGVEVSFQAPLDPYTRFKGFLAAHQEPPGLEAAGGDPNAPSAHLHEHGIAVSVEEAYMEWVALPGHTRLRVGSFRQQFGTLNRWHPHALPSADLPFALRDIFGHDGLAGLGIGIDWQLPGLWSSSQGLTVEITNADNDAAFAGAHFDDPAYLLRYTNFFDLGPSTYFELGLTGMTGPNDESGEFDTTLGGVDLNLVWEPVARAKYRQLEFRGEYIRCRYETDAERFSSGSFYAYLSWRLSRRWFAGVRFDDAELPSPDVDLLDGRAFREGLRERAWSAMLTMWQSEFVRLRLQAQHATRDFAWAHGPDSDYRLWLQVTFAAGPHKHESY